MLPGHVIIRRAAWERCGGYDESMRGDATASQAFMAHPTYGDGGMAARRTVEELMVSRLNADRALDRLAGPNAGPTG